MQGHKHKISFTLQGAALCAALLLAVVAGGGASAAPTETVLHSFNGADGANPLAGLSRDERSGNLYGTTSCGGGLFQFPFACGTTVYGIVFELSPGGTLTILYKFSGPVTPDGSDGITPMADLSFDVSGNLYGTTVNGGSGCGGSFCGTVFRLSPPAMLGGAWTKNMQLSPCCNPQAGLISDFSGNLYGTTFGGGGPSPPSPE